MCTNEKPGPQIWHKGTRYVQMPDLFNFFFTGIAKNEYSIATTSLLYNIIEHAWDSHICEKLGLPSNVFCEVIQAGDVLGQIRSDLAEHYDIPILPVAVVAGHDTASAVAGIPFGAANGKTAPGALTKSNEAYVSLGTWGVCGTETERPLLSEQTMVNGFGNEGSAEGGTFLAKNMTGLWLLQRCREIWSSAQNRNLSWNKIDDYARQEDALRSVIDVDYPRFSRADVNMPDEISAFCREHNQPVPENIGQFACCVYAGLVMKIRRNIWLADEITGRRSETIYIVGGGTKNQTLCQWIADALGRTVKIGPVETTVLGNALMQLKAVRAIDDIRQGREIIRASFATKEFSPRNSAQWDQAYQRSERILT